MIEYDQIAVAIALFVSGIKVTLPLPLRQERNGLHFVSCHKVKHERKSRGSCDNKVVTTA